MIHTATYKKKDDWNYIVAQGVDLHSKEELGKDFEEFWFHLEALTGKRFSEEHKNEEMWSCSC